MPTDPGVRTREDDPGELEARLRSVRREGRKRTIVMSMVAAGIVSLFIGRAIDISSNNAQVDRSRKNCELLQSVTGVLAETAKEINEDSNTPPRTRERWIDKENKFRSAIPPGSDTCAQVFPKDKLFIIFG